MNTESLIVSQLLINEEYSRKVLPHLKEEYFSSVAEKNFLKIYSRFYSKFNKIPSKQALLIEIENLKSSADVYTELVALVNSTVEFDETLDWLVEETEKYCKERALFNALRDAVLIIDGASKSKISKEGIPSMLQDALAVCFDTSVGHNYVDDSQERFDYYHATEQRIKTGITEFDKITKGGFPRKTLNVFLAPPHGGKSMVMANLASGALKHGFNVLYITMEMAEEEIGRRFDVNLMGIDFDTLEVISKDIFKSKFNKITRDSFGKLVIKEYPTGGASAANFRSLLSELKTKQNFIPDMIVVDYMSICSSDVYKNASNQNSYTIIGSIGKELRALASEINCAIITAVQTTRSGSGNSDVDITHTSESFGIPAIADFFAAIINTDQLKDMSQLMFKQLKNRYAGLSINEKFLMGVDYLKQTLYSLDPSTQI
jgi:replicative DNA helicase